MTLIVPISLEFFEHGKHALKYCAMHVDHGSNIVSSCNMGMVMTCPFGGLIDSDAIWLHSRFV